MYLYRTQHKVLKKLKEELTAFNQTKESHSRGFNIYQTELISKIHGLWFKTSRIQDALYSLANKEYVSIMDLNDGSGVISIRPTGLAAINTFEFKKHQYRSISIIARDLIALLLAGATIYALIVSKDEVNDFKKDLKAQDQKIQAAVDSMKKHTVTDTVIKFYKRRY